MNKDVRKITDGAMMCAIVGVLLAADRQLGGILAGYLLFLFPLPMVFFTTRYGWKPSWVTFTAMALLSFVISTPQTAVYAVSESFLGMVYGAGIYENWDRHRLVVLTMFLGAVISILTTVVFAAFFGYDLTADVTETTKMLEQAMSQTGMAMPANVDLASLIRNVLVVSAILTGVLEALVTHFISMLMFRRLRMHVEPGRPLQYYFPPKWAGYLGIAGLVAYYYSVYKPLANSLAQNVVQGLGMCAFFYLIIMGALAFIVIGTMLHPKSKKWMGILAFLMMMIASLPTAVFGFLYITTDMHQRMLKGDSHAAEDE
jgi:hypothetical protein